MSTTYLTSLPRKYIRTVAGHHHEGHYFVARAQVLPSASLLAEVFPLVERDLGRFRDGTYASSLSGQGFLRLLQHLKTVFLQDSVLLRERWPQHPNFQLPLFATAEYRKFAADVLAACRNPEVSFNERVHQVVPEIALDMQAMKSDIQVLKNQTQILKNQLQKMEKNITQGCKHGHQRTQNKMYEMARDIRIHSTVNFGPNQPPSRSTLRQQSQSFLRPASQLMPAISADPSLSSSSAQSPTASTACSAPSVSHPPPASLSAVQAAALPPAALRQNNANDVPQLIMDRTATTVLDIWWEWHEGRGGKPSVVVLNERHGCSWRHSDKNAYSRRKKLIDEICKTADAQHKDPVEIAQQFEDERLSKGKSLNWMWETWVMERRKGRS